MKKHVIDNSAIIPLFFQEDGTVFIQELFGKKGEIFIAPTFLAIELSNVFTTGIRRQRITQAEGAQYLHAFQKLPLELVDYPSPKNLQHVLDLSTQTGLSFYDTIYLGLAEQQAAVLVTHDKQLRLEAQKRGIEVLPV